MRMGYIGNANSERHVTQMRMEWQSNARANANGMAAKCAVKREWDLSQARAESAPNASEMGMGCEPNANGMAVECEIEWQPNAR